MARILIGMSGGVGSSVAASILKRDTHDVVGVTLLFDDAVASLDAAKCAADMAAKLGIEHQTIDASDVYEQRFAAPVAAAFAQGQEPSLAALFTCDVLMPLLFNQARALKCAQVATGHYAGTVMESGGIGTYPWRLMRAHDTYNDQSYLLWRLSQDELNRLRLPLAQMQEMNVRVDAMRQGLMVPQVPSGQSLYLYGSGSSSLPEWLAARGVKAATGDCVDLSTGTVLGRHDGLPLCPLGKKFEFDNPRAGMPQDATLPPVQEDNDQEAAEVEPLLEPDTLERYVAAKDMSCNIAYVGSAAQASVESCVVKDVFWTSIHPIDAKRSCRVRLDMQQNPRPCTLAPMPDGRLTVSFTLPVAGLASGKSVVFYSDDMVLGGGIIA